MRIGEIAQQTGVSKSIIRYYESRGVLPRPDRDAHGYRSYGEAELTRIRFVTSARRLGCSFPEIKALIALQEEHHVPSSQLLQLLACKMREVEDEMERLREMQATLSRLHTNGLKLAEAAPAD